MYGVDVGCKAHRVGITDQIDTPQKHGSEQARLTRRTTFVIVYVMNTKLTLRMDEHLVRRAKAEASRRGKSVSQMVSEFVDSLRSLQRDKKKLTPSRVSGSL